MNRPIAALFAALEAFVVVAIGIGISLVPLTFMWAFQYGLQIDWAVFWRASVDVWLLGHGADVLITLDPATATAVGFPAAGTPFVISIAVLGLALLTALLGMRAGRRLVELPFTRLATIVALAVFAALSFGVTMSALHEFARPSLWQGTVFPTLVFAFGLAVGGARARARRVRASGRHPEPGRFASWWAAVPVERRAVIDGSLRGGVAAASGLLAVSGILVAVLLVVGYGRIIALYEGIHSGVLGGVAVTLGELALLPNLVVWAGSWLVGPGFSIGVGSSVGPLGTSLGPLPAVPVLGALPPGPLAWGFLGLLVPIIVGFLAGVAIRPSVARIVGDRDAHVPLIATGLGIGVVGGVTLGLLAWVSAGSAGPGRLAAVGPDAFQVGLFAALEFGVPAILGLLTGRTARNK